MASTLTDRERLELAFQDKIIQIDSEKLSPPERLMRQMEVINAHYTLSKEEDKRVAQPEARIRTSNKTCALYARVSTKGEGQDTDNQLSELRRYAEARGWTVSIEYIDHASGSGKQLRPGFDAMMAAVRKRQFDILLFWSLDRLSREGVLKTIGYLQYLNDRDVQWMSFTEQYLDSLGIFREAVLAILAVIAKQERMRIVERTTAGMRQYESDYAAGVIGKRKSSKSGKNLPIGRPKIIFNRGKVEELRAAGKSWNEIVSETGQSKTTIRRALGATK